MANLPLEPRNADVTSQNAIIREESIVRPKPTHQQQRIYNTNSAPGDLENSGAVSADNVRPRRLIFKTMFLSRRSKIRDDRDRELVKVALENYPEGYPRFSAYINSDVDTVLFRRFGTLHARVLLYTEVELTALETELKELDKRDSESADDSWKVGHSIHLDGGAMNETRKELVEKIVKKLEEYDDLLLREASLRKLQRPSKRVHRNFMDYLYTEHPFEDADQSFVYHEQDFVTLQEYQESWLDNLMHRLMRHCRRGILRHIFVTSDDQAKTSDPHMHYYSENRLGTLIKIIIAVASTALLLVPIYLFLAVSMSKNLMATVTLLFAFAFATAVSVFTSARRQEVFAATAAYCAVLVVFIGNLQQRQTG